MKLFKLATLSLLLPLAFASMAAPTSGIDPTMADPAIRIQDDLFRATNGNWLKKTAIPADKAEYGSFHLLRDLSDQRVRAIVEELAKSKHEAGSVEQKIGDYYASFTDTDAIDKAGLAPIKPILATIDALKNAKDLAQWLGKMQGQIETPVSLGVVPDLKNPTVYQAITWQGGLGLPDRDYYLKKDDARLAKANSAYLDYLTRLATFLDEKNPSAAAKRVMALETQIAQLHYTPVENRNIPKLYNPMTPKKLAEVAPGFNWALFLQNAGLSTEDTLVVAQPSVATGVAKLYAEVPLADWKLYFKLHALDNAAPLLPKAVREAHFAFRGTALSGTTSEKPRWQRGIAALNESMGEAIGQVYVARHFPPEAKARMQQLVANLLAAYKDSIDGLSWMSPVTKAEAQDKLAKYGVKIGYPDQWRDYRALDIRDADARGNAQRSASFEWQRQTARSGKPVDRLEWGMTPQTVNAQYNPFFNDITFPAAILQPPFFDMSADDAANYGAIGAVIGHEISHGFDDQGSQFDGNGKLRNWWTPDDRKAFEAVGAQLAAQYDAYEPLPGQKVNGKLTLGENIADLSGLQIAYKAYQRSLGGKPAPVIAGLTGDQRFFMGWSQSWRGKMRDEQMLQQVKTNPHAPSEFRANGAALNHDGFHNAFGTKPGDKMYKPENERIRIW
jgi:putative endopeptidase